MSRPVRIITAIVVCLLLAGGSYLWATGQMDSVFAYRSPISNDPPAPGQAANNPLTSRVVFVLVDALREDTARDPAVMPTLDALRSQGAWAVMHSQPPSYSQPGYSVLLTGAWPYLSDGPAMNVDTEGIWTFTQDNLYSAAHRAGVKTAISAYLWFEKLVPAGAVDASFYTAGEDAQADRDVLNAALPWIDSGEYGLILIHIDQVDYAGHHEGGPRSPDWNAAATRADALIAEITAHLDLSKDTLVILSDHGQIDIGGHGGQDPVTLVEPFVLVGAGVRPGQYDDIYQVDVTPTLAVLLGANIPAASQGEPLVEMLALDPDQSAAVLAADRAQKSALYQGYYTALAKTDPPGTPNTDPAVLVSEVASFRAARLSQERLPRILITVILVVVMAALFFWRGRKKGDLVRRLWLIGGAVLMIAIFNFRYTVLDHNTYSMSSVVSATWLVVYAAFNALVAFLAAWVLISFVRELYRQPSGDSAEFTLNLGLTAAGLLAILALVSFAINGPSTTWALPEWNTWYLGFFALVQILMFAGLTPLFAGLSALVSAVAKKIISRRARPVEA